MIPLRDNIPSRTTPWVTYGLLALNIAVFLVQLAWPAGEIVLTWADGQRVALQDGFTQSIWTFGLRPVEVLGAAHLAPATPIPEGMTVLTSMFMHGSILHIGGNMLYLWIFADNIEDALGRGRFLLFYLLGGLAAAGAQLLTGPDSSVPMVGASGAIAAVLGGYLVLYPRARVLTLVPLFFIYRLIELPAVFFLGFWFLLQLVSAPSGGGTAWFAHIGGFLFGLIAARLLARRLDDPEPPPPSRGPPRRWPS